MTTLAKESVAVSRAAAQAGRSTARLWEIDAMRGVAIVMMVIYHFLWDLYFYGLVEFATLISPFWKYFQRATASNFITLVGVSVVVSTLAYHRRVEVGRKRTARRKALPLWKNYRRWGWALIIPSAIYIALMGPPLQRVIAIFYLVVVAVAYAARYRREAQNPDGAAGEFEQVLWRGLTIFGFGEVITLSVALGNTGTVDFGVLHLIGFSIIASYPFRNLRWINIGLWLMFNLVGYYLIPPRADDLWLVWLGWRPSPYLAVDYFPLFPWFGVVLLGIGIGNLLYSQRGRNFSLPDLGDFFPFSALRWLGQRSLFIYLIHQPLLFVLVGLLVQLGILRP